MKRTLALILTVLMLVSMIPATLLSVIARGPGVVPNGITNQSIENAPYQYIPETVVVDGILDDTAWPNEDWNIVNSETGTWSVQYPTAENATKFFKYQLKVDYYYLYGAVVMNSAPTGAVTIWLNDEGIAGGYTDKFVIDFEEETIKRYDNTGAELVSYAEKYNKNPYKYEEFEFKFGTENGKKVVEFRSHRADICDTQDATFSFFVSAEFEAEQSLFHPAIEIDDGMREAERSAKFPSLTFWPEGAQVIDQADVNGYGDLSAGSIVNVDGRLDEAVWAAQTEFYHKWYERTTLPSWVDNQQGGNMSNTDYKDFADISANLLSYSAQTAAKFDLYITNEFFYGAALVHNDNTVTGETRIDFSLTDESENTLGIYLNYAGDGAYADWGYITKGNGTDGAGYWDVQYHGNFDLDESTGKYNVLDASDLNSSGNNTTITYYSKSEEYDGGVEGGVGDWQGQISVKDMGLMFSQRPAGPNLYTFEFAIPRSYIDSLFGFDGENDDRTYIPSQYDFTAYAEPTGSDSGKGSLSNTATGITPRYFKNPQGEFYKPYTTFTPDGTLGERAWPGIAATADRTVNGTYYGTSSRSGISYMPILRGDLQNLYGSVVLEASEAFGNWKRGTANSPEGGDVFELWLSEDSTFASGFDTLGTTGTAVSTVSRYGIWLDENGNSVIGKYNNTTESWEVKSGGWKVVIKEYENAVTKKPVFENFPTGEVTGGYDVAYTEEKHDYYVIEFSIPWHGIGSASAGITLNVKGEGFNTEAVASESVNPIFYYYTSMHVAPADSETENTTGCTMFYPRTNDADVSDGALTRVETAYSQIFNKHDVFFTYISDGKIIEGQRVGLGKQDKNFSNSEYRVPSAHGNVLGFDFSLKTNAEYTIMGANIDGKLIKGAYSANEKTMVTLWIKDTGENGGKIYRYNFFHDGSATRLYIDENIFTGGYHAYEFSSANDITYFEAAIITADFDTNLDGFDYFIEITQVIGEGDKQETLSRVAPKITLPEIDKDSYAKHFDLEGNDWTNNAGTIKRIEHFPPDAISIDGENDTLNDIGWKTKWTFVSRDINACGQETNPIDTLALTDFYYQMRMDEDYLYVAAIILYTDDDGTPLTKDEIINQNPGFRLWIKSGEYGQNLAAGQSTTYTNYYDIKLSGYESKENTFPTFANNTHPFYNKYYQYVNPDSNGDGYFTAEDYASGNNTINTVVGAENSFSTFKDFGYGDSTLWGETVVTLLDAEGKIVNDATGQTRGELVDTGAIIKKIGELKKNGGDSAVEAFKNDLATKEENPTNIEVSTGVEAGYMKSGAGLQPNGFSEPLGDNTMVVEFKIDLDEFGGRELFQYYVSSATHNSWTSKTTMYPAIVSEAGSSSNYFHVNYPYWKWTDEQSFVVDEDVRAELMMRTYKRPVTTLGAKVSETYLYKGEETNAIRFGGLWNEEYIRKVNGLRESDGYTKNPNTVNDNVAFEGHEPNGNYTDYWDVKAMGMVFLPTHLVNANTWEDKDAENSKHPGNYDLFVDTPGVAWMDADGIVDWVGPKGSNNNFCDYENFAFYVTLVNVPDNATNMNFCFRGFVTYYDGVSGATPYYDVIMERSIDMVVDAASSSTDGDQTWEDEALHKGPFTDDYYKPGTETTGDDKENPGTGEDPNPNPDPDPQNKVINSIELTTEATIADGVTMFYPTVYSVNGDTSLADAAKSAFLAYWYDATGTTRLDPDNVPGTLVAGTTYDLYVKFTCNDGYEISDDCVMTLSVDGQTLVGKIYNAASDETNLAVDFEIVVPGGADVVPVPDVTYVIDYVNPSNIWSATKAVVLTADTNTAPYTLINWNKVLLEYDETNKAYEVIAVCPTGTSTPSDWYYGGNRVFVTSYPSGNAETSAYLATLTVGDYVQITGADFETLKGMSSDEQQSTIGIGTVDVQGGETPDPEDPEVPVTGDVMSNAIVNDTAFAVDTTVILASNSYATIKNLAWWNKAFLEYDDNEGYYRVVAVLDASESEEHYNWTYGIDRIFIAAHKNGTSTVNDVNFNFIGSLEVGDLVMINGTTHATLCGASSNTTIEGLSAEVIEIITVERPAPEVVTPEIDKLVPNATNGEKVAYVPLDDRPVHTDRVKYLAAASGIELVMPSESDYATILGTSGHGGNPTNILAWLKTQEANGVDYYVIALDQVFSGGLVNSRYSDSSYANGGLTAHDMDAVEFLTELATNNYVVYTDTVMRLASTSGYRDHDADTYNQLRAYGAAVRYELPDNQLTLENVINSYRYSGSSNGLTAISYTNTIDNSSYTATETDIDGMLAARERKLRIIDYLIKNAGGNIDRLMIGVDDSSSDWNLQANEIKYIKSLISDSKYNLNATVFAGADEMGLMGIAAIANDNFASEPVKVYFRTYGPALNSQADMYDNGTLYESLQLHLAAMGCVEVDNAADADIEVLVLTRAQPDVTSTGDASPYASQLATQLITNLTNDVPTAIIDASNHYGAHANYAINAMINAGVFSNRTDATEILGYSQWNTVGNAVGISMANAIARYAYLMSADEVTAISNENFMKGYMFSMIKDNCYKPNQSKDWTAQTGTLYAWKLMPMIDNSNLILGKGGNVVSTGYTSSWIAGFEWPWDREFEMRFEIGFNS